VRDLVPRWYEYDANVLVILAIAAVAILACVVLVSLGRGGELTEFPPDVPPLDLPESGQLTAVDFMALQLPVNLVGYHTQSVDETLRRAAGAISARDTRIAVLEQRVSELLSSRLHARQEVYASPGAGVRTDHEPEAPTGQRELPESGDPVSVSGSTVSWDAGAELRHRPEEADWRVAPGDGVTAAAEQPEASEVAAEPDDVQPEGQPDEQADELKAAEPENTELEDAEPEDTELEDAEPEDTEPEDTEPEDGRLKDGEPKNGELKGSESKAGEEPGEVERPVRAALGKNGEEST
jgi:hypothetical protein